MREDIKRELCRKRITALQIKKQEITDDINSLLTDELKNKDSYEKLFLVLNEIIDEEARYLVEL